MSDLLLLIGGGALALVAAAFSSVAFGYFFALGVQAAGGLS